MRETLSAVTFFEQNDLSLHINIVNTQKNKIHQNFFYAIVVLHVVYCITVLRYIHFNLQHTHKSSHQKPRSTTLIKSL